MFPPQEQRASLLYTPQRARSSGLPSGSGYFSPAQVPGLVLWIDPDDDSTKTVAGGNVTAIRDKAQGLSFTVPSGANAPADSTATTGDGRTVGALDFDGASSEALAAGAISAEPLTVITVVEPNTAGRTHAVFALGEAGQSGRNMLLQAITSSDTHATFTIASDGTNSSSATAAEVVANEPFLLHSEWASSSSRTARIDGTSAAENTTTDTVNVSALDQTAIGWRPGGIQYFEGKILAVLAFNRVLSDAEREQVEDYLHREKIHDPGAGIPAVGLVLDLDATDADSLTITSSPDVDAWSNRANKGITSVTQGTAANKPHTGGSINGLNALAFDNAASQFLGTGSAVASAAPFSFLSVSTCDDLTDASNYVWSMGNSANTTDFWGAEAALNQGGDPMRGVYSDSGSTQVAVNAEFGITAGAPLLAYFAEASATDHRFRVNGFAASETASVTPAGVDAFRVGKRLNVSAFGHHSGNIGRILAWKRVLSDAERARGERALAGPWGVTLA